MEAPDVDSLEGLRKIIERVRYADESEENEKIALKCIQKAQFFKDLDLEFEARHAYIRNVTFLNKDNLAIAMFPWLLARCDEDRQRFPYYSTLWTYKWIISNVKNFARIPLSKIEELIVDFERRFRDYGAGDKVIHYFKVLYYTAIGELAKATTEYQLYLKVANQDGLLDDCDACQPNNLINYLVSNGEYEEALKMAEPIVQGDVSCHVVPETTYPKLIWPSLKLGKWQEAENYAVLAKKKLSLNQANLREASHLITYYALKQDFTKGRRVVERQFAYSLRNVSEVDQFYFYLALKDLFANMQAADKRTVKLNLPPNDLLFAESGTYSMEELQRFVDEQLPAVSSALDHRNGNSYYADLVSQRSQEMQTLAALVQPLE